MTVMAMLRQLSLAIDTQSHPVPHRRTRDAHQTVVKPQSHQSKNCDEYSDERTGKEPVRNRRNMNDCAVESNGIRMRLISDWNRPIPWDQVRNEQPRRERARDDDQHGRVQPRPTV